MTTTRNVSTLLPVDFFTRGYRISGHIDTRAKTVGDLLNDPLSSYIELNDVYIGRANNPGEIIASYRYSQLLKDNLLFVIVSEEESFSKRGRSVSYFGKQKFRAFLALSTYEIEGDFVVTGRSADFEAYLAKGIDAFIPIESGIARLSNHPDITFGGEAFLVNRKCIDLFCLEGK
ncbi:MAG: hypothetical protein JW934_09195 [Anaerolineae bacterium]|nr:hypothetical protein [Anaerolineae bacterium]